MTKLIDEVGLHDRLLQLLTTSTSVDIAIAWIRCGKALDAILHFAKNQPDKLRVVCGVNGFITQPEALFQLFGASQLKIAYDTSGKKLHSKMFLFHNASATTVWVGSANLTESAFSINRELVCEMTDNGSAVKVFKDYWEEFNSPDSDWLEAYNARCRQLPASPYAGLHNLEAPKRPPLISKDWEAYVARLRTKDPQRLKWIADSLPEITHICLSDWQQLSRDDAGKLLGTLKGYGALGNLKAARDAKRIFYESTRKHLATRQKIADALDSVPLDPAAPAFGLKIKSAFRLITEIDGVAVATLTRLLAVRRPDCFISVSGASRAGLSRLSGIPEKDLRTPDGYADLIRWLMKEPWWSTPDPQDETSMYWRQRAALLDVLAYSRTSVNGTESDEIDEAGDE